MSKRVAGRDRACSAYVFLAEAGLTEPVTAAQRQCGGVLDRQATDDAAAQPRWSTHLSLSLKGVHVY
jgi:hypothetical protein